LKHGPYTKNFYKNLLINGNKLSPSASIVNKDFILKNNVFFNENKKLISVEDYDFWLRLALKNAKFRFINKELSYYCINKNNLTNNKNLFFKNLLNLLRYHVYYIQKFDDNKLLLFIRLKYKVHLIRIKQFFFSSNFFNYFNFLFK
jgi:GT2 family glycosyltransferase